MNDQPRGLGDNLPPPYDTTTLARLAERVREVSATAPDWLGEGCIDSEENEGLAVDYVNGQLKPLLKQIEAAREREKEPHLSAGRLVDSAFNSLKNPIREISERIGDMLADWSARKAAAERERRAAAQAEADAAAKAAREAAAAARARHDILAAAAADAEAKAAEKAAAQAAKPVSTTLRSASGGARSMSMRTYHTAQVGKLLAAVMFFAKHPLYVERVTAFVADLAEAEHRRKDGEKEIPGITFTPSQKVA